MLSKVCMYVMYVLLCMYFPQFCLSSSLQISKLCVFSLVSKNSLTIIVLLSAWPHPKSFFKTSFLFAINSRAHTAPLPNPLQMLKWSCITRTSGNTFPPALSCTSSQDLEIGVRADVIKPILHSKYQTCLNVCSCDVTFTFNPHALIGLSWNINMHDFGDQMGEIVNLLGFILCIHPSNSPLKAFLEEGHGELVFPSLREDDTFTSSCKAPSFTELVTSRRPFGSWQNSGWSRYRPSGALSSSSQLLLSSFITSNKAFHNSFTCSYMLHTWQTQFEYASSTLTTKLLNLKWRRREIKNDERWRSDAAVTDQSNNNANNNFFVFSSADCRRDLTFSGWESQDLNEWKHRELNGSGFTASRPWFEHLKGSWSLAEPNALPSLTNAASCEQR